jgi:hypothetical protein
VSHSILVFLTVMSQLHNEHTDISNIAYAVLALPKQIRSAFNFVTLKMATRCTYRDTVRNYNHTPHCNPASIRDGLPIRGLGPALLCGGGEFSSLKWNGAGYSQYDLQFESVSPYILQNPYVEVTACPWYELEFR